MIDDKEFTDRLTAFLANSDMPSSCNEVNPDTDLFDIGALDSIRIIELIILVEDIIDAEIPVDYYKPESFRTLAGIYQVATESFRHARSPQPEGNMPNASGTS